MPGKGSSGGSTRRRLMLFRLLLRGPAPARRLIAAVEEAKPLYPDGEAVSATALRRDILELREEFGCQIDHDPRAGYRLVDAGGLAVLDLGKEAHEGFLFLHTALRDRALPHAPAIGAFLDAGAALPRPDPRPGPCPAASLPRLSPGPRAPDRPDLEVAARLERAIGRRIVRFRYRSTVGPSEVEYTVSPIRLYYEDLRVDRILPGSLRVTHDVLPPALPRRPLHHLRYWLAPRVSPIRRAA